MRARTAALGQAGHTTPSSRVFPKHLIAAEGNGGRWLSLPVTVYHAHQILTAWPPAFEGGSPDARPRDLNRHRRPTQAGRRFDDAFEEAAADDTGKDPSRPDDVKGRGGGFPDQPILGIDAGF